MFLPKRVHCPTVFLQNLKKVTVSVLTYKSTPTLMFLQSLRNVTVSVPTYESPPSHSVPTEP